MGAPTQSLSGFGALAFALFVCATAATAQQVRDTSFLKDESQLQPGRGKQARLVYINPEIDFSRYDKAVVERVALWFRDENADGGIEPAEQQHLAGYFTAALRHQLQLEFHPVEKAQPGALRVRAAITRLSKSGVSVAIEVVDAVSGSRLAAAKDAREAEGGGSLERILDAWAERVSERLGAFHRFDAAEAADTTEADRSTASPPPPH
jgi:hypothetical protein